MSNLTYANSFRDLLVYKKSLALSDEIFRLTTRFPRDEIYSLTSQIRRSSRSVGAQIAEAWAKRRYEKHFISKLSDADGEQMETQHWLEVAINCDYLARENAAPLFDRCAEIGRLLGGMMSKASLFCKPEALSLREIQSEYFTASND
jgi:four helix bundle protein